MRHCANGSHRGFSNINCGDCYAEKAYVNATPTYRKCARHRLTYTSPDCPRCVNPEGAKVIPEPFRHTPCGLHGLYNCEDCTIDHIKKEALADVVDLTEKEMEWLLITLETIRDHPMRKIPDREMAAKLTAKLR